MKKVIVLPVLVILIFLNSCKKEEEIFVPITDTTTVNVVDTTTTVNVVDTTTTNVNYKLVECTYEYVDYNNSLNNINYFGHPYNQHGITTDFRNDFYESHDGSIRNEDILMVNMPMYPEFYMPQPTMPLYYNGEPEWFILTVTQFNVTEDYVNMNVDMRRLLCPATIYGLEFTFSVIENNGILLLILSDHGNNWETTQTMRFEPI